MRVKGLRGKADERESYDRYTCQALQPARILTFYYQPSRLAGAWFPDLPRLLDQKARQLAGFVFVPRVRFVEPANEALSPPLTQAYGCENTNEIS